MTCVINMNLDWVFSNIICIIFTDKDLLRAIFIFKVMRKFGWHKLKELHTYWFVKVWLHTDVSINEFVISATGNLISILK